MAPLNLSATVNALRVLKNPALCYPHLTIATFNDLPVPLGNGIQNGEKQVDIRAVILDKDNCFAVPHALEVYPSYNVTYPRFVSSDARMGVYSNVLIETTYLWR